MADRRHAKTDRKIPHASKKYPRHIEHQDYDSNEEEYETIEMEDRGERFHAGEGRLRNWHRNVESRSRRYDSDEENPQDMGNFSTSDREFRDQEHRPRTEHRHMGYENYGFRHAVYQKQFSKRQNVYMHENAGNGDMNAARNLEHHSPESVGMGYRDPYFYQYQGEVHKGRTYPENMEIGHWNRGFLHTDSNRHPEPRPLHMDRGFPPPTMPHHPGYQYPPVWNTQIQYDAAQYPQAQQEDQTSQKEEEVKKPRKVWWYTACRVFSAILIILNLVSDWLQYADMHVPINDVKKIFQIKVTTCNSDDSPEAAIKQYMYFTIAGTIMAVLQLANIIYQIVQNHRLKPNVEIRNYLDERTEVFLITAFVRIPQNYLLHRAENCITCGISWDPKSIRRFLSGLSSLLSSLWRYLTNIKVSSSGSKCSCSKLRAKFNCSKLCGKCLSWFGNCIKDCLKDCFKCICPCCCCCFDCKTFIPCCCCYVIYKNRTLKTECVCSGKCQLCDPNAPSILADLAALPTGLYTFLYTARVMKYFRICNFSTVYDIYNIIPIFINDVVIHWIWGKIFD